MGDIKLTHDHQNREYVKKKAELEEMTRVTNVEFDKHMAKRSKIMALMTDNNQNSHMQGRLRNLFLQWAAHTKRQRHFANCIQNVCTKSLWQSTSLSHARQLNASGCGTRTPKSAGGKV